MKKLILTALIIGLIPLCIVAQKNVRSFIFGHSLIHHEYQMNPTPSQETSVPHWFHFLAQESGHDYAVSGQYGFLPQHANLPPIALWGFDFVPGAWDSDNEPFSDADFTNILITPGNFIQWQGPNVNYPNETTSPLAASNTIFDWCEQQEDSLIFFIYENWPDMATFLNTAFPPNTSEWNNYNDYLNGEFHQWFLDYHDALMSNHPDACVRMIPVGPIISKLLKQDPFDQIPIESLYEDDAPHGRPTIYFLATLVTYMAMYEEEAPASYQPPSIIHPIIADQYQAIIDFIWNELNDFNDKDGFSRVFCLPMISSITSEQTAKIALTIRPNPTQGHFILQADLNNGVIEIIDVFGNICKSNVFDHATVIDMDISSFRDGVYYLVVRNENKEILYTEKILKVE